MADGESEPQIYTTVNGTDTDQVLKNALAERQKIEDEQKQAEEAEKQRILEEQKKADDERRLETAFGIKPGETPTDAQLLAIEDFLKMSEQREARVAEKDAATKDSLGFTYTDETSKTSEKINDFSKNQEEQTKYLAELKTLFDENSDKEHHDAAWELFDEFIADHNIDSETQRGLRDYLINYIQNGPNPEEVSNNEPQVANVGPSSDNPKPYNVYKSEGLIASENEGLGSDQDDIASDEHEPSTFEDMEPHIQQEILNLSGALNNAKTLEEIKNIIGSNDFNELLSHQVKNYDYSKICALLDDTPENIRQNLDLIPPDYGLRYAVVRILGVNFGLPSKPGPKNEDGPAPQTDDNLSLGPNGLDWDGQNPSSELPPQPSHDEVSGEIVDEEDLEPASETNEDSNESADQTTEMPAQSEESTVDSADAGDETELKSIWERIKMVPIALQDRINVFFNSGTPEQNRTRKILAAAGGAFTVVLLVKIGMDANHANDVVSATNSGTEIPTAMASHAGDLADVVNSGGSAAPEAAGNVSSVIHEQLKSGETIWGNAKEALRQWDVKPSFHNVLRLTREILNDNNISWSEARHLATGTDIVINQPTWAK